MPNEIGVQFHACQKKQNLTVIRVVLEVFVGTHWKYGPQDALQRAKSGGLYFLPLCTRNNTQHSMWLLVSVSKRLNC